MNVVFVSPNFPYTYWNFCDRLKKNGANVLGIGDCPYDALDENLKRSLTEYYKVNSLEDYDEVYRAAAFFSFKYGKIDWLESNNEYWLEQDSRLRLDFNITTGDNIYTIGRFKSKFAMKEYYKNAGVPSARCLRITGWEKAKEFVDEVGFPVIVKPEVGVGAEATWKLNSQEDFDSFFDQYPDRPYVMEEFVCGDIYSYDAIVDYNGDPLFESSAKFPPSMADIVNYGGDLVYYVLKEVPPSLKKMGRAVVKSFGVKSRFVHFEFFRLTQAKDGLGEIGDFVGLEVNMRPAGGYTPDMMNFAHSTDVYQIWADMVTKGRYEPQPDEEQFYCVYIGRRDNVEYVCSHEDLLSEWGSKTVMCDRVPDVLSNDMGNQLYMVKLPSFEEVEEFVRMAGERA